MGMIMCVAYIILTHKDKDSILFHFQPTFSEYQLCAGYHAKHFCIVYLIPSSQWPFQEGVTSAYTEEETKSQLPT